MIVGEQEPVRSVEKSPKATQVERQDTKAGRYRVKDWGTLSIASPWGHRAFWELQTTQLFPP